jgi:hypothetical protein
MLSRNSYSFRLPDGRIIVVTGASSEDKARRYLMGLLDFETINAPNSTYRNDSQQNENELLKRYRVGTGAIPAGLSSTTCPMCLGTGNNPNGSYCHCRGTGVIPTAYYASVLKKRREWDRECQIERARQHAYDAEQDRLWAEDPAGMQRRSRRLFGRPA